MSLIIKSITNAFDQGFFLTVRGGTAYREMKMPKV